MELTPERLQEIKEGDYLLHGTEEWTNQEDADTETVILELITAYEQAQAEVERLEKLYNDDRANYLDDITLLQTKVDGLRTKDIPRLLNNYSDAVKRGDDLQTKVDVLGDSLYNQSPDSAELHDYTPTWKRDDPR